MSRTLEYVSPVARVFRNACAVVALVIACASVATAADEPVRQIDPAASQMLRKMSDYMAGLKTFTVDARNTLEVVLEDGQKLNFEAQAKVTIERPNHFRVHRVGVVDEGDAYYDGKTVTVFVKREGFYATSPVPPTLDAALDFLRDHLALEIPGADLVYSDVYDGLMWDVTEARDLGVENIGGVSTHHLAFRATEVDFQIWIEDGSKPLPRKYVITSKKIVGAPQFGVELSNWNLAPEIDPAEFRFTAPAGARRIDFLPSAAGPVAR